MSPIKPFLSCLLQTTFPQLFPRHTMNPTAQKCITERLFVTEGS